MSRWRAEASALREWAINDWAALVEYRDRTLPHANYEIDVPRLVDNLSQPEDEATGETIRWLRDLMEVPSVGRR